MSEKIQVYEDKMEKTLNNLHTELQAIRAGRANPHVLDKIEVDYYGSPMGIQQVANVSVPEARIIQITPWEGKMVKEIIKAIQMSDLGLNPMDDGKNIRLIFPELTEERRKQLDKEVQKTGEDAKVAVRNIRRDGNDFLKKMKKQDGVSEDEVVELEEELTKISDKYVKKVDVAVEEKSKEIMTV